MPFHWWNIKIHTPRMFSSQRSKRSRLAEKLLSSFTKISTAAALCVCVCQCMCVCRVCVCVVCCILLCGVFSRSFGPLLNMPVNKFLRSIQNILFISSCAWTWPTSRLLVTHPSRQLDEEPSKSVPSGRVAQVASLFARILFFSRHMKVKLLLPKVATSINQ